MQMEVKKLQFPQILQEHEINTSKTHHGLLIFLLIWVIWTVHPCIKWGIHCSCWNKVFFPTQNYFVIYLCWCVTSWLRAVTVDRTVILLTSTVEAEFCQTFISWRVNIAACQQLLWAEQVSGWKIIQYVLTKRRRGTWLNTCATEEEHKLRIV